MNRIHSVLFLWGIVWGLTACGQNAASTGNLAQDININAGSLKSVEKSDGGKKGETETAEQETRKEEEGVFSFLYEGVSLVPGEFVDCSALPKYSSVAEVPSCAFGGNDKVYNFKAFELTTHIDEEGEIVYSIYFIDPNLPTTEGLRLGDTAEDMISLYGENYEAEETAQIDTTVYTYTREETSLIIITQNDNVIGMEYRLQK